MARFNGGVFSKLKGKLAGIVFQQYEGIQVGKEYQPNVKNPNSDAQVANRARFKGASQLLAVNASVLMAAASKVSSYDRMVRGKLIDVLFKAFEWDDETKSATIDSDRYVAAVNSLNLNPSIPAPVLNGVSISEATIQATEGDTIRYTISALDSDGNLLGSNTVTLTAGAQPASIQAPLIVGTPNSYDVVAVAMRSNTENGMAIYSNIEDLRGIYVTRAINAGDIMVSHIAQSGFTA